MGTKVYQNPMKIDQFSPPAKDESPQSSSLVNDNDTTINLAQIERVNSISMSTLNDHRDVQQISFHRSTSGR